MLDRAGKLFVAGPDPTVAIVATEQLNPDDKRVVSRIVAGAGYKGVQLKDMVHRVASLVVGRVIRDKTLSPAKA